MSGEPSPSVTKPKPLARLNHFTLQRIHELVAVTVTWVRLDRSTG